MAGDAVRHVWPEFDLNKQYEDILRKELNKSGHRNFSIADSDIGFYYHNIESRRITETPREVVYSKSFYCPPHLQNGLKILTDKIEKGESLTPNQSKSIGRTKYTDKLFAEWGIQHFHLGEKLEHNGRFVSRTKEILFAFIFSDTALLLSIEDHGSDNPHVWSDIHLLELLLAHAPDFMRQHEVKGTQIRPNITSEQRSNLRRNNINSFVTLSNNKIYSSPGRGVMSSGVSMHASWLDMQIRNRLREISEKISSGEISLEKLFFSEQLSRPENPVIKLEKSLNFYAISTERSNIHLLVFPTIKIPTASVFDRAKTAIQRQKFSAYPFAIDYNIQHIALKQGFYFYRTKTAQL